MLWVEPPPSPSAVGLQVLPVAPPHVRPSVSFDGVNKGDDELTYKYVDIIKANNMLLGAKKSGQTEIKIQVSHELLACAWHQQLIGVQRWRRVAMH